jgi:flagellar basal-body rod modification protein FlgD
MTSINSIGTTQGNSVISGKEASFGENPFLSLLITQLRNQTPLEPVDNQSFMQQMATYSSMEEQKELNSNMLELLNFQGVLARLQSLSEGSTMLGKEVTFALPGDKTGEGVVNSIFVDDKGEVRLRVGEQEIGMNQITGISEAKTKTPEPDPKPDPEPDPTESN